MSKIRLIFADNSEEYLIPLEQRFIDAFDDMVEIIEITDTKYLQFFFNTPQTAELLFINENLYNPVFSNHNIASIFILTEQNRENDVLLDSNTRLIYKYTSAKEIFNEAINSLPSGIAANARHGRETKVITVYSPIGGIGKTTVSMGLCSGFAKIHRRTLYIGTDNLQTFRYLVNDRPPLKGKIEKQMALQSEYIYDVLKPTLIVKSFHIVPPFEKALSSLNIKANSYIHLIESIKKTGDYDFIVLDCATDFSNQTSQIMGTADHNIIVGGQDPCQAYKLKCLLENIDYSDRNKFTFICNKFQRNNNNVLVNKHFASKFKISEYIEYDEKIKGMDVDKLSSIESLHKLAFLYI